MSIRSVLVTGANRGIGLEFIRQLVALPNPPVNVIASCRNPDAAQDLKSLAASHSNVKVIKLDVSDTGSFESVKEEVSKIVKDDGLHLLLNNAGIMIMQPSLDAATEEALIQTFKVNTVGPVLLTKTMRPLLKSASKPDSPSMVVNMGSQMGSIADASKGLYAYRCSKAALHIACKCFSNELKDDGILTCIIHPGWVKTDIGGANAKFSVTESVEGMMKLILRLSPENSGKFWNFQGDELPW